MSVDKSKSTQTAYDKLIKAERERSLLISTDSLLSWDESVYMPPKGTRIRGEQRAMLARLVHQSLASPETGELVDQSEKLNFPAHSPEEANVREIRRNHRRAVKIPADLVEEMALTISSAREAWVEARKKSEFSIFLPFLEKVVALKQREAEAVGYETDLYDALLDHYEPGAKIAEVKKTFAALKPELVALLKEIQKAPRQPKPNILVRKYPVDQQRKLGELAAQKVGFDFARGRLDTTTHPFCSGFSPDDVRITTRYDEQYFSDAFSSILHETGHGMYEQGLDLSHYGTPAARACSYGIHESQSRIWENYVAKGRPFWEFFYPTAQEYFPESLGDVSLEDFLLATNEVCPSFIRVDADEVTYNLHIILRLEMEEGILSGDIRVKDIPAVWNEKFETMFGIRPPNDAQGCLQDIHWCWGSFGYFPTYALGNMYGAQFVEKANADLGDLDAHFRKGEFAPFLNWLRTNIHQYGQRYEALDLVKKVTGKSFSHEPLVKQLRKKYGILYGFGK